MDSVPESARAIVPQMEPKLNSQIGESATREIEKMIQLPENKYNQIIQQVENFANQSDDQFNQLLLYIFTGIFYLFMLDMMYQLGKKSY